MRKGNGEQGEELPFPNFPSVEEDDERKKERKTMNPPEPDNPLPEIPGNHPETEVRMHATQQGASCYATMA